MYKQKYRKYKYKKFQKYKIQKYKENTNITDCSCDPIPDTDCCQIITSWLLMYQQKYRKYKDYKYKKYKYYALFL